MAFLLADLGVTKTHSRPHVSDDNSPFGKPFRTMTFGRSSRLFRTHSRQSRLRKDFRR